MMHKTGRQVRGTPWPEYSAAMAAATFAVAIGALFSGEALAQSAAPRYDPAAWDRVVAAARKEGSVNFYSVALPAATERMVNGFKKAYPGIGVEVFRAASAAVMPRIDQERANSADGADVVVTTDFAWFSSRAKEKSFLAPAGPALRNWPMQHMNNGYPTVALELFVIPYNKALVKSPPQGYADLLKPEFKGRVGTLEAGSQSVSSWYDWLEKTQGADFLNRLKDQNPKLYVSTAPLTQAIVAGEILAGVLGIGSSTKAMMATGAPMDYVVPNPAYASSYAIAALPWAKRPNAARVFMDYVMSVEGQTAWHGTGETASPLKGIPGALDAASMVPYNPDDYPTEWVNKYSERWRRIFK